MSSRRIRFSVSEAIFTDFRKLQRQTGQKKRSTRHWTLQFVRSGRARSRTWCTSPGRVSTRRSPSCRSGRGPRLSADNHRLGERALALPWLSTEMYSSKIPIHFQRGPLKVQRNPEFQALRNDILGASQSSRAEFPPATEREWRQLITNARHSHGAVQSVGSATGKHLLRGHRHHPNVQSEQTPSNLSSTFIFSDFSLLSNPDRLQRRASP
jgi:hypothetical protein